MKRFELKYRRELFRAPEFVPYDVPGDFQRKSQRKSHIRFKRRKLAGNRVDSRSSVKGGLWWAIAQCSIRLGSKNVLRWNNRSWGSPCKCVTFDGPPRKICSDAPAISGDWRQLAERWVDGTCWKYGPARFFKMILLKVDKRLLIE